MLKKSLLDILREIPFFKKNISSLNGLVTDLHNFHILNNFDLMHSEK